MNLELMNRFFIHSPAAFSYQKIIYDEAGNLVDFEVTQINKATSDLFKFKSGLDENLCLYQDLHANSKTLESWKEAIRYLINNFEPVRIQLYYPSVQEWVETCIFPLDHNHFAVMFHDSKKHIQIEQEIESFLKINIDMLSVYDKKGNFIRANHQFTKLLGYSQDEIENRNFIEFIHEDDKLNSIEVMNRLVQHLNVNSFTNRYLCKNGLYVYIEWNAEVVGDYIFASGRDVTELVRRTLDLEGKALIDGLTGLYNRHHFYKYLEEGILALQERQRPMSLILFDIDLFKRVNDTWGHPVGDDVLKYISKIVTSHMRKSDTVFRIGGEEFVILLQNTEELEAIQIANRISRYLNENTHPVAGTVTASFGVAQYSKNESLNQWYIRADDAMYRAKKRGRNRVVSSKDFSGLPIVNISIDWQMEWNSQDPIIDSQHQKMVQIGNQLIDMVLSNKESEAVLLQIDQLIQHTKAHFSYEEKQLREINFPSSEEHALIHHKLLEKAITLKSDYLSHKIPSSVFFSFIVDDLIVGHIIEEDSKYFIHLQNHKKELL
jgi:diguanylate cyclase (GGDEF)-like protein/hemerythrin-like metal-binding protein/PAS domain S-box-containing protein